MRWQFCDSHDRECMSRRNEVVARIDAWWGEFQHKTDQIRAVFAQKSEWDLVAWMQAHLQSIDPRLMWEFGPALKRGHRLVITPECDRQLRPMTNTVLERAPRLADWEFYAYRLPEDLEMTKQTVRVRAAFDISDFKVRVGRGEHNRVDLCYFSPKISGEDDQNALNAAFVATETLVGEELLDKWIGAIEVSRLAKSGGLKALFGRGVEEPKHLMPIDQMKRNVDAVIASILDQLPPQPHFEWVENAPWTCWELRPCEMDDYPEQFDIIAGRSANPEVWAAGHSGGVFCSERFSRCGETFCYVKLDGSRGLDEEQFADKLEIEDALDELLKSDRLGSTIGGGTGLRYSYIDLALCDVERGIELIRERLQNGNVSKRSWIQFYDSDFTAEWVGIYDDSPPPPMRPELG